MSYKKKILFLPYDPVEIYPLQSWLEDEAAKGWQLKKISGGLAIFESCTPCETRYRLDVQSVEKYPVESELRQDYAEAGWEYVTDCGWNDYCIYRTNDPEAIELHTDPTVLKTAMHRRIKWQWIAISFAFLFLIWLMFRPNGLIAMLNGPWKIELLTGSGLFSFAVVAGWLLLLLIAIVGSIHRLRQTKKNLDAGYARSMDSPSARCAVKVMYILLLIVILAALPQLSQIKTITSLKEYNKELHLPLWNKMSEQEAAQAQKDLPTDIPHDDFVFEKYAPFSDEIQCLRQFGGYTEYENGGSSFNLYYDADYYDMKQERYASALFQALLEYDACERMTSVAELDEAAWGKPYGNAQSLILRVGDIVIYIHYNGTEDLRSHMDLFEEPLLREVRS